MKKFLSIRYSNGAFNLSMLILRVAFGLLMLINHGLPKLMNFSSLEYKFYSFIGMGSRFSLILDLFAEIFCSLLVTLGLFTRLTVVPLIIVMLVAVFGANSSKPFLESELAVVYLAAFLAILLNGPGKISVDAMIN